jgi:hypothetical protein
MEPLHLQDTCPSLALVTEVQTVEILSALKPGKYIVFEHAQNSQQSL